MFVVVVIDVVVVNNVDFFVAKVEDSIIINFLIQRNVGPEQKENQDYCTRNFIKVLLCVKGNNNLQKKFFSKN